MPGCLRGCLGKAVALVLVVAAAYAGWRWGPAVFPTLERWAGRGEEAEASASPELAEATLDRVEAFRAGADGDRLLLGQAELSSVVRYALPGIIPPGVADPTVELSDGRVVLSARVATSAFPDFPSLEEIVGILPDTIPVRLEGQLVPLDDDFAALHIDRVQAMRIPLPQRFVGDILHALGRSDRTGLPDNALAIPLPTGLESAYVLRDSLVLVADR